MFWVICWFFSLDAQTNPGEKHFGVRQTEMAKPVRIYKYNKLRIKEMI